MTTSPYMYVSDFVANSRADYTFALFKDNDFSLFTVK